MPDNLGKVMRCESRVTTRLRYVQKSMVISGSQITVEVLQVYKLQRKSVVNVSIDLNAPNGVFTMNDTESGEDLLQSREKQSVVNET
jgi:hypothetical protein